MEINMKRLLTLSVFVAGIFLIFTLLGALKKEKPIVNIGSSTFLVEIADSVTERTLGLSRRNSLPEDSGLLFVFESVGYHGFWMKDMRFPIDIIWIKDDKVVYVLSDVSEDSYPQIFTPGAPANKVLEINAGLVRKLGIKEGDPFLLK
jgi:uncharacterized protein